MPDSSEGSESDFSGMNMGNNSGMSSMGTGSFSGTGAAAVSGNTMQSGNFMQSQDSESSLFGNSYDLTEAKNLLERTPSSTEDAEELLEQLKDALQTVQEQYAELTRNRTATELEIQYTYDQAIIAGKLAEVTYQQEMEGWEETLEEAQNQVTTLEEEKAALESMTDGILCAEEAMSIAAVNYEAGDELWANTALYSYYDMDTLTVPIEVSQYDIAQLTVGETVEVSLSGVRTMEGTISSKALEPVSGTSRTTVNYEVEISLDNSSGRLSSGVSATVTVPENTEETESEENQEVGGNS